MKALGAKGLQVWAEIQCDELMTTGSGDGRGGIWGPPNAYARGDTSFRDLNVTPTFW